MKKLIGFLGVLVVFCCNEAQAALHLELTQGMNSAIPIAIVPFANRTNNVSGNTTLTDVIKNDLQNSGEFRVKTPDAVTQNPTQTSQIDANFWRRQGVNDVVIGQVHDMGSGRVQVSFQLISLYAQANQNTATLLLNKTYRVQAQALRDLAHHISDVIYQSLTGVRGIFSTKIAYVLVQNFENKPTQYLLSVADMDGFRPQVLLRSTQPIMSPAWLSNGKALAYVSFEGRHAAIYLQGLASGQRQLLSRFPGINGAPDFSPDGTKMALVLSRTGNPNIYVMNLRTKQLTQITRDFAIDTEPTWSLDGNSLYFTSNRGGGPQIYQYHFATQQISRVTFDGDYNARACVSRHGEMMIVLHRDQGQFCIAKQDLSSGRLTVLTNSDNDDSPSLAPNGKMILYGTHFAGRAMLGIVSTDGRVKLRLPAQEGNAQDPAWSPYL